MASQSWGGWNSGNVFDSWDLNPLAAQTGVERDKLSLDREAYLKPLMNQYRSAVGGANSADDDQSLWGDNNFQNYVRTGQVPTFNQPQQQTVTQQWTAPGPAPTPQEEKNTQRNDELYKILMDRATQGLTVDRNDPAYRQQVDSYAANEERARRQYLERVAEERGGLANLRGEERMSAERVGQRTGTFEGEVAARAQVAKRQEIAEALESMRGMLSQDQQRELQRQIALIDADLRAQGYDVQRYGMDLNHDQALRGIGLEEWDRMNYWDALRRGQLGG